MTRKIIGWTLTVLGIVLVTGALAMAGHNLLQQEQAGDNAEAAMEVLAQRIQTTVPRQEPEQTPATGPVYDSTGTPLPDYVLNPYMPMPETDIDGLGYIGYLEIPALELTLPVISENSQENLNIAPCRYYGSAYRDDLVIGAHRYARHFGNLYKLGYGDEIIFTDVEGNVFTYEVADMETLQPYEGEYLCSADYDLSLYTCTVGGAQRVTVRCERVE